MGYRKQPFGYRVEAGRLVIDPQEAETVISVFSNYRAGMTYKALAAKLNDSTVRYYADKPWNINMIDRILKDERYIGEQGFPAIIDKATLDSASRIRSEKIVLQPKTKAEKALRQLLGSRLPKGASENATSLLNQLIEDAGRVQTPTVVENSGNGVAALLDALREQLNHEEVDVGSASMRVKEIAALQYAQIGNGEYETERLRRVLAQAEPMKELDEEILKSVVISAEVDENGEITLILKNGQTYRRK